MADAEKQPLKEGEEGKEGEEPEKKKKTCGDHCEACTIAVCTTLYTIVTAICNAIKACLVFFWYPVKDYCGRCCDDCDKRQNQWKNPAFTDEEE